MRRRKGSVGVAEFRQPASQPANQCQSVSHSRFSYFVVPFFSFPKTMLVFLCLFGTAVGSCFEMMSFGSLWFVE
jgi:hypothetical protein